jgi:hypothetical protein
MTGALVPAVVFREVPFSCVDGGVRYRALGRLGEVGRERTDDRCDLGHGDDCAAGHALINDVRASCHSRNAVLGRLDRGV